MSTGNSFFLLVLIFPGLALGAIRADKVHLAENKKTQVYIQDGLFVGGDRMIDQVIIKDIRRASNAGFERLVIDLEGNRRGEQAAIARSSYFQVAVSPEEKRIVFTIWGNPTLSFDSRRVVAAFKRSLIVEKIELFPRLEDEMWSFVLFLKGKSPAVEVFELSQPARIIVDIRPQPRRSP